MTLIFQKVPGNDLKRRIENNITKARLKAYKTNRQKRKNFINSLRNKNLRLLQRLDDLNLQKLILSILYLAEGAKNRSTQFLSLGSSDPLIIKLFLKLLGSCLKVSKSRFRVRIQSRYDQDGDYLEKYWANLTKIDRRLFYPTYKDARTKGIKTKKRNYKGVCCIHYFDTKIQLELELLANSVIKFVTEGR